MHLLQDQYLHHVTSRRSQNIFCCWTNIMVVASQVSQPTLPSQLLRTGQESQKTTSHSLSSNICQFKRALWEEKARNILCQHDLKITFIKSDSALNSRVVLLSQAVCEKLSACDSWSASTSLLTLASQLPTRPLPRGLHHAFSYLSSGNRLA